MAGASRVRAGFAALLTLAFSFQMLSSPGIAQAAELLPNTLLREAEKHQVIRFNPDASVQKRIFADGFVPNSTEFGLQVNGTTYTAQRAENLATGQARVYYVVNGDWANVRYAERGSDSDALATALLAAGDRHQVIRFNPEAALQKGIFADGFVPNSAEFNVQMESVTYLAQRAENLTSGQVGIYYAAVGDWGNVKATSRSAPARVPPAQSSLPAPYQVLARRIALEARDCGVAGYQAVLAVSQNNHNWSADGYDGAVAIPAEVYQVLDHWGEQASPANVRFLVSQQDYQRYALFRSRPLVASIPCANGRTLVELG